MRAARRIFLAAAALGSISCEPSREVDVSSAPPLGTCQIVLSPAAVDFGMVSFGSVVTRNISVANEGSSRCQVSMVSLLPSTDSEFSLAAGLPARFDLIPGAVETAVVSFSAQTRAAPHLKTGTLEVDSTDPLHPAQTVALSAQIDLGCDLLVSPNPLNFGNIGLNIESTEPLTLTNDGTQTCSISALALAPGTDADFSLAMDQPTAFDIAPGATAQVPVTFDATSPPPNLRVGAVQFASTQVSAPMIDVPLQGYIDTNCTEAGELIYTVDGEGNLASFDPDALTFTNIGSLNCPSSSSPFSMAVDQHAIAWVEYLSGELFRVDTRDASCTPTSFQIDQSGFENFGMGFLFDANSGIDTLFIAGGQEVSQSATELGTIAFPSLQVTKLGTVSLGWPELTGTGDGQLWGFVPSSGSASGVATVAQIDPVTGETLQAFLYPELVDQGGWAMKFFGGSFWIFLGNSVYAVSRETAAITVAIDGTSPNVVGAGVSTCAPLNSRTRSK